MPEHGLTPKALRMFLAAISQLAAARGIEIDTSFDAGRWFGTDVYEWVLNIRTNVHADVALAFWDDIDELPEYPSQAGLWRITVSWNFRKD